MSRTRAGVLAEVRARLVESEAGDELERFDRLSTEERRILALREMGFGPDESTGRTDYRPVG